MRLKVGYLLQFIFRLIEDERRQYPPSIALNHQYNESK